MRTILGIVILALIVLTPLAFLVIDAIREHGVGTFFAALGIGLGIAAGALGLLFLAVWLIAC